MYPEQVRDTGADILLGNTYHLMLRPGAERVAALGGLHDFMDWQRPILTDSGGFQVMSLAKLRKLNEHGVTFRSHIDGSAHELTPERSIEIQTLLDSDIIMQLDECIPLPSPSARRWSAPWSCRCAGPSAPRPPSATSRTARCSASCRAATIRNCVPARRPGLKSIGFSRLLDRRPRRRRTAGGDVPRPLRDHPGTARPTSRAT